MRMAPTFELLSQAARQMPPARIANAIGLHANTVKRWMIRREAPRQYRADLMRILGQAPGPEDIPENERDQFYTRPDIAEKCWRIFNQTAGRLRADLSRHTFIEPAAGCGWFYNLLPPERRIGLDIAPKPVDLFGEELRRADFLLWNPPDGRRCAVVGNPPFGLRGHLALQFINRAAEFADLVGFILPQMFESDGKGAPMKRVDPRLTLARSERLPPDSFVSPEGVPLRVSTVFQVWTKINRHRVVRRPPPECESFVRVYSLSDGGTPSSTRNRAMIGKCDVYLPSTCYDGMRAYRTFRELPNARGYGVVAHRRKREIVRLLLAHDWTKTAFISTNSAMNLRRSLIKRVVAEGGFQDE